jgi:hypothetical protein
MLGLTSIVLSFLENLRSIWVVVKGLELLSLACPGLDLGSVMLHYLCHPCYCYGYVDPICEENMIWGDGNGTGWCDANGSRLCPVRCWKLWLVIIPKSKDRFMERPPMKTVQP